MGNKLGSVVKPSSSAAGADPVGAALGGEGSRQDVGHSINLHSTEKYNPKIKPMKGARLSAARIRQGNILNEYSFEAKILGCAFSGPVRLAVNRRSGRRFAVKPFLKAGANKYRVNMLRNESSIYLRLDHPHIAKLIEVWEDDRYVNLVMEYCSGGQVYDHLCASHFIPESSCRLICRQMLLAINYLHKHKVVHRDIKLENWMYQNSEDDSSLKLTDFGFAKIWDSKQAHRMHATCGTLAYVSPDVLLGGYTSACDLWSLGVVVYMMLVGYPPFFGSEEEMFRKILDAQYSLRGSRWNNISERAKDFVVGLLNKDPLKRFTAEAALNHCWFSPLKPLIYQIKFDVAESFESFYRSSKFQQTILQMVAYSMTSNQIDDLFPEIRNVFLSLDKTNNGTIRLEAFKRFMQSHYVPLTNKEITRIYKHIAGSETEEIHFSDFLAAMLINRLMHDNELIRGVFTKLDSDHSGFVTFQNICNSLAGDERYTEKRIRKMFAEADGDGNGLIDYSEFNRLVIGDIPVVD